MQRAAQCLLGENDFTSFRAVQCQSRTPWRNVMHINVTRYGAYVVVDIKALLVRQKQRAHWQHR